MGLRDNANADVNNHDRRRSNSNRNGRNKNNSNSISDSKSNSNATTTTTTLRILGWSLFLCAQCCLIKMYHDAAYKQSVDIGEVSSSLFEQELVLQGILSLAGGTNTKKKEIKDFMDVATKENVEEQQQQQQYQKRKLPPPPTADGIFNGYPIYKFQNKSSSSSSPNESLALLYSQFHCVGETWEPPILHRKTRTYIEQSWVHRSCHFQLLCYDTSTQEYNIYLDPTVHTSTPSSETSSSQSPSPLIQKLLDEQKKQRKKEQIDAARIMEKEKDSSSNYNFSQFKHPSYFDDTSTTYRNKTVIVDANGETVAADTHWNYGERNKNQQYGSTSYGVSIGSMNGKWGEVDGQRLKWFPTIVWKSIQHETIKEKYDIYTLPSSVLMIPFHSLSASNPGHLVWDDFLPMYTLLDMYGFTTTTQLNIDKGNNDTTAMTMTDLLPIRYQLPGGRGLWAGCDWLDTRAVACEKMLQKFGTLLGTKRSKQKFDTDTDTDTADSIPITTNKDIQLRLSSKQEGNNKAGESSTSNNNNNSNKSKLICSKNGVAGFGGISDHGDGKVGHGWDSIDYLQSQNPTRGGQLYSFRNYMIHNLFHNNNNNKEVITIPNSITDLPMNEPLVVLFSSYSSTTRSQSFKSQVESLRNTIQDKDKLQLYGIDNDDIEIQVQSYTFSKLSLEEQITLASKAAIFVTISGGGAITASFLPRGGSVLLYYRETGGVNNNRPTGLPARLDWDFFNHAAYLHVHWLPVGSLNKRGEIIQQEHLILTELSRIYHQRKQFYTTTTNKK